MNSMNENSFEINSVGFEQSSLLTSTKNTTSSLRSSLFHKCLAFSENIIFIVTIAKFDSLDLKREDEGYLKLY